MSTTVVYFTLIWLELTLYGCGLLVLFLRFHRKNKGKPPSRSEELLGGVRGERKAQASEHTATELAG